MRCVYRFSATLRLLLHLVQVKGFLRQVLLLEDGGLATNPILGEPLELTGSVTALPLIGAISERFQFVVLLLFCTVYLPQLLLDNGSSLDLRAEELPYFVEAVNLPLTQHSRILVPQSIFLILRDGLRELRRLGIFINLGLDSYLS